MLLSIIVPAYNEETNLENTINSFLDYLKKQNYDYEVIIVNDGSTDKTADIALELAKKYLNITLISTQINKGKGAAVREGLVAGKGDYCLFIDADNATDISHLDSVWPMLNKGIEIVIASRSQLDHPETVQEIKQVFWKRHLGIFGNRIIQFLAVRNIWDTQCGFKIFSKKALDVILPRMTLDRWAFDAEMLAIAQKHELEIGIIPVVWKNSSYSRVGLVGYLSCLNEVFKIRINLVKGKYS